MFEFSVARKYLTPRWRQLSVSIISLISILVIALVVWLIVVFFSVTNGLEKGWVNKLITLTAPVRVTPTENYYDSYYYLIDTVSSNSDYTAKSIREKLNATESNPYDETIDPEIPGYFAGPLLNADGFLKDLVKEVYLKVNNLNLDKEISQAIIAHDYEVTTSQLRIKLLRNQANIPTQGVISQAIYLGSFDKENQPLDNTMMTYSMDDLNNAFQMLSIVRDYEERETQDDFQLTHLNSDEFNKKLKNFLREVNIEELKTSKSNWIIPKSLWPLSATINALVVTHKNTGQEILVTQSKKDEESLKALYVLDGAKVEKETVRIQDGKLFIQGQLSGIPLKLAGALHFPAKIDTDSVETAKKISDLRIFTSFYLQGILFEGDTNLHQLSIAKATIPSKTLSFDQDEAIFLPKTFRDAGVLVGDLSYISYYTPTMSAVQEQKTPTVVAGFYDPGLIPLGGKFILAPADLVSLVRVSQSQGQAPNSNGINVRFENLESADLIKHKIQVAFKSSGLEPYFKVETYKDYEFTKDILQQLQSDKLLFTLISTIIIIVACSNIISMLIIMVNDKKVEIGILRSMGTSSMSIATIFGLCGIVMGVMGSAIGVTAAYFTLKNIKVLINILSDLQGHNAFNPMFYGETLPNEISFEAMLFVIASTALISLIAGIVPAVKASMLRPSAILRSE